MLESLIIERYDGKNYYQEDMGLHVTIEVDKKYKGDLKDNNYVYTLSVVVRKKGSEKEYQEVVYTLDKKDDRHVIVSDNEHSEFGEGYITYMTGKIGKKVRYLSEVVKEEYEDSTVDRWIEESFGRVSNIDADAEIKPKENVEMVGSLKYNL